VSAECEDLIKRLLCRNVGHRLGCGRDGALEVMRHPWFRFVPSWWSGGLLIASRGLNWQEVQLRKVPSPARISVASEDDTSNFSLLEHTVRPEYSRPLPPELDVLFSDF